MLGLYAECHYAGCQNFICCYAECRGAEQSVTKIMCLTVVNLVTPRAGAEHELFFETNRLQNCFNLLLVKMIKRLKIVSI
jgi:hypothetical protein